MSSEAFSSIDQVAQCMLDIERSEAFQRAINATVRAGDLVLDVGTGSGLLAMFAAKAGARKVIAVEFDPVIAEAATLNVKRNGLGDIVEVRVGDAREIKFSDVELFDVVVMEMLTTGMIDEMQIEAVNNLHRQGVVGETTKFVPQGLDTHVRVVSAEHNLLGLEMPMVRHLWRGFPDTSRIEPLTKPSRLHRVDFSSPHPVDHASIHEMLVGKSGFANGLLFESLTRLTPQLTISDTLTLNAPVLYPIAPISVKESETIRVSVSYKFGHGFGEFRASADRSVGERRVAA